uniref:Uncharacterized protein n=1 Tax=Arundo donax TaxID=35708 RepID=A0A0A9GFB8_ARUDO
MLWGSVACPRRARTLGLGAGGCGPTPAPPCFGCCAWNTWGAGLGRRCGGCTPPPNTGGKSPGSCTAPRSLPPSASPPSRFPLPDASAAASRLSAREKGWSPAVRPPPAAAAE